MPKHFRSIGGTALTICFLPIIGINLSYIVAVSAGTVPACFPYLDGCTSISSTGRHPPSSYIFKPALFITAVLMIWFWFSSNLWLSELGEQSNRYKWQIIAVGAIGGIALMIYVYYLGTDGAFYRFMRRFGVTTYFGFTYLAQLLLASRLYRLALQRGNRALLNISRLKLTLCLVLLVIGLISIPVTNFVVDNDIIKTVIEWNLALLMHSYFLLSYKAFYCSKLAWL
jgi:hypothetical protein